MQNYRRFPTLQSVRAHLSAFDFQSDGADENLLVRAIRETHDNSLGTDVKHIFRNPDQCLDELISHLGLEGAEETLLPRIDKRYALTTLLERLQAEKGLRGLSDYAIHLIETAQKTGPYSGRYDEKIESVLEWLNEEDVTTEPFGDDALTFRRAIRTGAGPAALIGLGKCGDPAAAIHLILFNVLNGLDIVRLTRATEYLCRYFSLLLDKPDWRLLGRGHQEAQWLQQLWIAEKLGYTCPASGADLYHHGSHFVISAHLLGEQADHLLLAAERWDSDHGLTIDLLSTLTVTQEPLKSFRTLAELLEIDFSKDLQIKAGVPVNLLVSEFATDILHGIYKQAGCFLIQDELEKQTAWCSADPTRSRTQVGHHVDRLKSICEVLTGSLRSTAS